MQIGGWPLRSEACVPLLVAGLGLTSLAATDPFLLLSTPTITSNQLQLTVTGETGISYVIEASTDLQAWSVVATNTDTNITRLITLEASTSPIFIRARRTPLPIFANALVTKLNISLKGNNVHFDSFDSADINYSTSGKFDPAKAKAGGNLASGYGFIDVGNANINGRIKTASTGTYSLGPFGYVGPIGWTGPGLYSADWYQNDFRFVFPDVMPPFTSGLSPTGTGTNYWVLASGDYYVNGDVRVPSSTNILVDGTARLYVTGQFQMRSMSRIIMTPGTTFNLYSGTGRTEFAQLENAGGAPAFQYYGLPAVTNITWVGNTNFSGVIYAPQATLIAGGGGLTTSNFSTACIVRDAVVNGNFEFHYDENLKRVGPMR